MCDGPYGCRQYGGSIKDELICDFLGGRELDDGYYDDIDGIEMTQFFFDGIGPRDWYFDESSAYTEGYRSNSWFGDPLGQRLFEQSIIGLRPGQVVPHNFSTAGEGLPGAVSDLYHWTVSDEDEQAFTPLGSHHIDVLVLGVEGYEVDVVVRGYDVVDGESASRNPITRESHWPSYDWPGHPLSDKYIETYFRTTIDLEPHVGSIMLPGPDWMNGGGDDDAYRLF